MNVTPGRCMHNARSTSIMESQLRLFTWTISKLRSLRQQREHGNTIELTDNKTLTQLGWFRDTDGTMRWRIEATHSEEGMHFGFAVWNGKCMVDINMRDPKGNSFLQIYARYSFRRYNISTEKDLRDLPQRFCDELRIDPPYM